MPRLDSGRTLPFGRWARFAALSGSSILLCSVAHGCGGNGEQQAIGTGGAGSHSSIISGTGGSHNSGGDLFDGGMWTGDGGLDPDAACAASSFEAKLLPVNMFIMFDKSGSMIDKWADTTGALIDFFQDPKTAGLRVALRFFPDNGCHGASCDVAVCGTPLVPLGELTAASAPSDAQEEALVSAISGKLPDGGTPTYAALAGAEQWAMSHQNTHPNEKTVVVLVTDGQPNGCEENVDKIAKLASDARSSHGVLTYAVGLVGSHQDQMNAIAAAGGTNQAFFIGNGNAEADLLMALQAIQGSQLDCIFAMPPAQNGDSIDPALITVDYTPGGAASVSLNRVADKNACGNQGGFYYDDPNAPTQIALCPSTCQKVKADPNAKIQILAGCATPPPP